MGYYSYFEATGDQNDILKLLVSCKSAELCMNSDGSSLDSVKWYGWKENLLEFAKANPDSNMEIERTGEGSGDLEKCYIFNGTAVFVQAEIVWPSPPPGYLEEIRRPSRDE